eukprot:Gregarina_sp_Poly_1__1512@NODE_137_length_13137_cov_148_628156_g122_i0_p1_GENE_NODE_137_length_13137_cov_148_628156_g122_i0NODE_137_length_13137_cov_148_628156_g122_i0_p1_ORF_typecomplete_len1524_score173_60PAP_assoc/PF03828_19/2_5e07PAP_central/PF04928_17/3_1e07NTP_transf_2/PF01909_23/0_033Nrap_D2/PF17403_2/0_08PsbU/PF06514_11/0_52_NODE_137_length_13137_cov_148_628156_g122_i0674011311
MTSCGRTNMFFRHPSREKKLGPGMGFRGTQRDVRYIASDNQRSNFRQNLEAFPTFYKQTDQPITGPKHVRGNRRREAGKLWDAPDLPQHIRDEFLPALESILRATLNPEDFDSFVCYNTFWHPTCPEALRTAYGKAFPNGHPRQRLIPPRSLAEIVYFLRGQTQVIRLLADRGPDYALTLLMLLDIVFQVAFCMRRTSNGEVANRQARRNMAMVIAHCPRLLEVLSLHSDCAPIAPYFLKKFILTCQGFLFHRKVPNASVSRFYQLQYFLSRESRPFIFKPPQWSLGDFPDKSFLPLQYRNVVEQKLWSLARHLSLGKPSAEVLERLKGRRTRQISVTTHLDAMAVIFERLNHIARAIFGTCLCSYGSAATGFATQSSDVDVVLQLGQSGVSAMLTQLRNTRNSPTGVDLNPFPSKTIGGFTPAIGDWSWTTEKSPSVAASIWAGRIFAWAIHRLYGWHVQCVQSAYVPIVRILGCVGSDGRPRHVPEHLRPHGCSETSPYVALRKVTEQTRHHNRLDVSIAYCEELSDTALKAAMSKLQRHSLCRLCAISIVSEQQYASWPAALVDDIEAASYLTDNLINDELREEMEDKLFSLIAPGIHAAIQNAFVPSPGLLEPVLPKEFNDGRLSQSMPVSCTEEIWLVEADFSADRQVGIHNSRLLRAYASCSPFVVALGLLVKHWAKNRGIGDAYAGYLSGYQWTLLVIHYLQHFFCLAPPPQVTKSAAFQDLQNLLHSAGLPRVEFLPLLPNLQHSINTDLKSRVTVREMEGEVEVSFFQPGMGDNKPLPEAVQESCRNENSSVVSVNADSQQREWPEDYLLMADPLMYAYEQLTPPFDLEPHAMSEIGAKGIADLWKYRLETAPKASSMTRRKDKVEEHLQLWDAQRQRYKVLLLESEKRRNSDISSSGMPRQLPFPSLSSTRSTAFVSDHIMIKGHLLIPFSPELTLTELLYGFFEYYGLRFNFATDISNIDRVPELPQSKKEFFETVLFTPKVYDLAPFPDEDDDRIKYPAIVSESESREERHNKKQCKEPLSAPEDAEASDNGDLSKSLAVDGPIAARGIQDVNLIMESRNNVDDLEEDGIANDDDPSHVTHTKEVVGRGNGPYQYQGRHFLCIRDPFEKLRTIGPPCRCQSHISTEFISAIQLLGSMRSDLRSGVDCSPLVLSYIDQLFGVNARGAHPVGRLWHPTAESLGQLLTQLQNRDHNRQNPYMSGMYPSLIQIILKHGKYKAAFEAYEARSGQKQEQTPISQTHRDSIFIMANSPSIEQVTIGDTQSAAQEPTLRQNTPSVPMQGNAQEKLRVLSPSSSQYEVDINCVPPGFEEHQPTAPLSEDGQNAGIVTRPADEEIRKDIQQFFQCPHFVPNFGEPSEMVKDGKYWRYSEEAVQNLKKATVCSCRRSRPQQDPPQETTRTPESSYADIRSEKGMNMEHQHTSKAHGESDFATYFADAEQTLHSISANVSRSTNSIESPANEEARQILLSLIRGSPQRPPSEERVFGRRSRGRGRSNMPRGSSRGRPRRGAMR